jgi:hypothetical protein
MGDRGQKAYFIEYNDTDQDHAEDWFDLDIIELEDVNMINDIANLLNAKYAKEPTHKYNKQ